MKKRLSFAIALQISCGWLPLQVFAAEKTPAFVFEDDFERSESQETTEEIGND